MSPPQSKPIDSTKVSEQQKSPGRISEKKIKNVDESSDREFESKEIEKDGVEAGEITSSQGAYKEKYEMKNEVN